MRTCLALVLALATAWLPRTSQAPSAQAGTSSKIWIGRYAEFERFLKSARIVRTEDIGTGITRPVRAYFAPGGLAGSAVVKAIDEGIRAPRLDSYRSEIAGYQLDRLLELDMVPPTVEREIDGAPHSVQLWADNCRSLRRVAGEPKPDVDAWNRQVYRMRVFDNLMVNIDRNEGNMLIDPAWNLILIDHSRAFDGRRSDMQFPMTKIDGAFFQKLKALDRKTLQQRLRPWLSFGVDPLLKQRDRIVKHFETLIAQQGEANVIIQ